MRARHLQKFGAALEGVWQRGDVRDDRLPLGAEEAIDRLTAVLGDDRSGLSFGFPFSRALDSLEANGLLVYEREAAS